MTEQLLNFFMPVAYADTAATAQQSAQGSFSFMIMFAIFFIFIYFTMLRPQNKRAKELQNLINSLSKGDEVVTLSGILGRITKLTDQYVVLSIASNVEVVMQKSAVTTVLPKGTIKTLE